MVTLPVALSSVLAQSAPEPRSAWAPVVLLLVIGIGFAVGNLVISLIIGPSRTGPGKEQTYESGMVPVGASPARRAPAGVEAPTQPPTIAA